MAGTLKTGKIEHPKSSGTITFGKSGQTVELASGATATGFGGKILQVTSMNDDAVHTTTTQNVVIGGTATITTSSATSKILVLVHGLVGHSTNTVTGTMGLKYKEGGSTVSNSDTLIAGGAASGSRARGFAWAGSSYQNWNGMNINLNFLHEPAYKGQLAYRLYMMGFDGGGTMYLGRTGRDNDNDDHPRASHNITLMEIGE